MPYRGAGLRIEPRDPEAAAIAILRQRVTRVRVGIFVPLILAGLVAGGLLYAVFRDWQFERRGWHFPWATAIMAFVPTFGGALRFGPRLTNAVVRRLLPRWRADLAREYRLDPAELEAMTRLLE